MSHRTKTLIGFVLAIIWGGLWWRYSTFANGLIGSSALLAGWFFGDVIRWLRKRKAA